jgi:adenine-specific DNA-methyltransferase
MAKKPNYDDWSKEELIKELRRIKEMKYGLVWHRDLPEEKIDVLINPDARTPNEMFSNEVAGKPFPVLRETKSKEIETDKSKPVNLLIEGNNYHSLAVLNFTHQAAIDVIYIDPPYNTGQNDFIYNDKIVDEEDPYRHSKWLSFIQRRLQLAKNLLKDTGLIHISIDDHELAQLRLLCDEVFGEKNFLAIQVWRGMHTVRNTSKDFNHNTEYILTYARNKKALIEPGKAETYLRVGRDKTDSYPHDDGDNKGPYKFDPLHARNYYTPYKYTFKNGVSWTAPKGRYPAYAEETLKEFEANKEINFDGKEPRRKRYLKDVQEGVPPNTLLPSEEVGFNKDGTSLLAAMFGDKVFDQPKPVNLVKYLLSIKNKKIDPKNITILDFMAGSGTTGHAVLELNKEDHGQRKFILCTNNENNICTDVCYPRIKKAIQGYKSSGENIAGLGGNLKYYACDFVEAEPTDQNKRKLVSESTEMLCIKENAFELVQDGDDFKIFKNTDKFVGLVFYEEAIDDFKKAIKKIKGHFNVYVFSLGDDAHEKAFNDVKSRVTLCAIPEVILKVYREIFK